MEVTDNKQYTVRQSRLIAAVGIVCLVFFLALTVLLISVAKDATEIIWVTSVFLVFILLGLFLTVYALKWRIEVNGNTLTMYHPFKRPYERSITFDEITSVRNGMNGLYIYVNEKRFFKVDTFAVGRGKLASQLLELSKNEDGLWQANLGKKPDSYGQPVNVYAQTSDYQAPGVEPYVVQHGVDSLKTAINELDKPINAANGIAILVAVINILLGVALTLFSGTDIVDEGILSDLGIGIYYIIPGLLFLGLSFGFVRRSRACMLIASGYLLLDAILLLIAGGIDTSLAFLSMRVIFLISLFAGVRAAFKYFSTIDEYATKTGLDKHGLLESFRLKTHRWQITTCVIFGCIGIGVAGYGYATDAYAERKSIDEWVEYTSGSVTIIMPSPYIEEYREDIIDMPGARYMSAMSENHDSFAFLVTHHAVLSHIGLTAEDANEIELILLDETVTDFRAVVIDSGPGYFPERVRFNETRVKVGHEYGVLRCFSRGNDIYIIGVFIDANDSIFFDSFFEQVVID